MLMSYFYCVETSPNPYGGLYPPSNTSVIVGQPSPMYNSRTSPPMEYQFPNNVSPNTFYGQTSLTKVIVRPPSGKLILFYLIS